MSSFFSAFTQLRLSSAVQRLESGSKTVTRTELEDLFARELGRLPVVIRTK